MRNTVDDSLGEIRDAPLIMPTPRHSEGSKDQEMMALHPLTEGVIAADHRITADQANREDGLEDLERFLRMPSIDQEREPSIPTTKRIHLPDEFRNGANSVGNFITFSSHPRMKLGNLKSIPTEYIQFLESQGCLHIPSACELECLIMDYFRHIHPVLPLLDEAEFWCLYKNEIPTAGDSSFISLFMLQAMLAASCPVSDRGPNQDFMTLLVDLYLVSASVGYRGNGFRIIFGSSEEFLR